MMRLIRTFGLFVGKHVHRLLREPLGLRLVVLGEVLLRQPQALECLVTVWFHPDRLMKFFLLPKLGPQKKGSNLFQGCECHDLIHDGRVVRDSDSPLSRDEGNRDFVLVLGEVDLEIFLPRLDCCCCCCQIKSGADANYENLFGQFSGRTVEFVILLQ